MGKILFRWTKPFPYFYLLPKIRPNQSHLTMQANSWLSLCRVVCIPVIYLDSADPSVILVALWADEEQGIWADFLDTIGSCKDEAKVDDDSTTRLFVAP